MEYQEYPKWVETNEVERTYGDNKPVYKRVLVQNEKEEEAVRGLKKEEPKKDWNKK